MKRYKIGTKLRVVRNCPSGTTLKKGDIVHYLLYDKDDCDMPHRVQEINGITWWVSDDALAWLEIPVIELEE